MATVNLPSKWLNLEPARSLMATVNIASK